MYEKLKTLLRRLVKEGRLPSEPTEEQKIDWAYSNLAIDRPGLTKEEFQKSYEKAKKKAL